MTGAIDGSPYIRFHSKAFNLIDGFSVEDVQVRELEGRETLSQPFEFRIHLVSISPDSIDPEALLKNEAWVVIERFGLEHRKIFGEIREVRDLGRSGDNGDAFGTFQNNYGYELTFAPRVSRLALNETSQIFMDLSVPQIIKRKLEGIGLEEGKDFEFRLIDQYPTREFVVQYQETDLNFVMRLAEHLGIFFFFEHRLEKGKNGLMFESDTESERKGRDVLIFGDHNGSFVSIVDDEYENVVPYSPNGEKTSIFELERVVRSVPRKVELADYNYRRPNVALRESAELNDLNGEVTEFGAHFKTPEEGRAIAKARAEELTIARDQMHGQSDRFSFAAGASFFLEGHPWVGDYAYGATELQMILIDVHHVARQTVFASEDGDAKRTYINHFRAYRPKIGKEKDKVLTFRPPRITPKPKVSGVLTGIVDSPQKGPYAEVDDSGRYRVKFLFDPSAGDPGKASRPVRMAQPHSGEGYGMHFPLRTGVEVIVTCIDGDPDRPIIAGTVPNPLTQSPIVSNNKEENIIRTGAQNEIRMNDKEGAPRIVMSSPADASIIQIGAADKGPESGIYTSTEGAITNITSKGLSNISTTVKDFVEQRHQFAWDNVISAAGSGLPLVKMGKQALGFAEWTEAVTKAFKELPTKVVDLIKLKVDKLEEKVEMAEQEVEAAIEAAADAVLGADREPPAPLGMPPVVYKKGIIARRKAAKLAKSVAHGILTGHALEPGELLEDFADRVQDNLKKSSFASSIIKAANALETSKKAVDKVLAPIPLPTEKPEFKNLIDAFKKPEKDLSPLEHIERIQNQVGAVKDALAAVKKLPEEAEALFEERAKLAKEAVEQISTETVGAVKDVIQEALNMPLPKLLKDMVKTAEEVIEDKFLHEVDLAEVKKEIVTDMLDYGRQKLEEKVVNPLLEQAFGKITEALGSEAETTWNTITKAYSMIAETDQRLRFGHAITEAQRFMDRATSRIALPAKHETAKDDFDEGGVNMVSAQTTAMVLGRDAILNGEYNATMSSSGYINVAAGHTAFIHAVNAVDLSSHSTITVTAKSHVDILADEKVTIIAHRRGTARGKGVEKFPETHTMLIRSDQSALFESTSGSIHLLASMVRGDKAEKEIGDITLDAQNDILSTAKLNIATTSNEGEITVDALQKSVSFTAKENFNVTVQKDVKVNANNNISVTAPKEVSVSGNQAVKVSSGSQITISAPNIRVSGRVQLG